MAEAQDIDALLAQADVIEIGQSTSAGRAVLGMRVRVVLEDETAWVRPVHPDEAFLDDERISATSPLAIALMGARVGAHGVGGCADRGMAVRGPGDRPDGRLGAIHTGAPNGHRAHRPIASPDPGSGAPTFGHDDAELRTPHPSHRRARRRAAPHLVGFIARSWSSSGSARAG